MVHHKYAEYIKLAVFRTFVVEEIVISLKQFFEKRVIIAASHCEDETGGNGHDECPVRDDGLGSDSLNPIDVARNFKTWMNNAPFSDHPLS